MRQLLTCPCTTRPCNATRRWRRTGIVSQQSLDNADRDYLAALNKKNVAVAQIDVDNAKLHQAEAQVAQNQASLK